MVSYLLGGGIFLAVIIIIFLLSWLSQRRGEYGTGRERALESRAGLGSVSKGLEDLFREKKAEELKEKALEEKEEIEKRDEKAQGEKVESEETKASEKETEAAVQEAKVEEASEAIEGRLTGITAALKVLLDSIKNYIKETEGSEQEEESEVEEIDALVRDMNSTVNFDVMDDRARAFMEPWFRKLVTFLKAAVVDERHKEQYHSDMVRSFKEVLGGMEDAIKGARRELSVLGKAERKERSDFKKEISEVKKSIKQKKSILKKALKKGKGADPELIAKLNQEISLNESEFAKAKSLNNQLQATIKFMRKQMREMKKLLRQVKRNERSLKKLRNSAKKREKDMEKKYKTLSKLMSEFDKANSAIDTATNPHGLMLYFSGLLNRYSEKHAALAQKDMEFDMTLKDAAIRDVVISQQMEAFQKLQEGLTMSEEAVEKGMAAMTEILAAIFQNNESSKNEQEMMEDLNRAMNAEKYNEKVEVYLKNVATSIEMAAREASGYMDQLIGKDQKLIEGIKTMNQEKSEYLGSTMATVVNRKVEVDEKFMSKAKEFENEMARRNSIAAGAYSQARRAESLAKAA